jgi:sterol desaturase/sphingolipid hydroxylase (fatty acid hydroxylase superfamily)
MTRLFGAAPSWVDCAKPAGSTPQTTYLLKSAETFWFNALTLQKFLSATKTLLIFVFAVVMHLWLDPYDFDAVNQQGFAPSSPWILRRTLSNFVLAGSFYTFYLTVVPRFLCNRKFNPDSSPSAQQLCHDVYYWALGILQWSFWECLVVRAFATGKLDYVQDKEFFSLDGVLVWLTNVFWIAFAQAFRSLHFYVAHRFSHFRPFYKTFHALHHRNVDVEPFSGLAMHPAEHLYYFTSMFVPIVLQGLPGLPPALMRVSPVVFRYAGCLPILLPGATHSGYEDHELSQQEHYIHHVSFNKNFGAGIGSYLDYLFGTYCDVVAPKGKAGDSGRIQDDCQKRAATASSKANLLGWPSEFDTIYTCICLGVVAYLFKQVQTDAASRHRHWVAFVVSFGPLIGSIFLWAWKDSKVSWRWPFEREPLSNSLLHIVMGLVACVWPVYLTVLMTA